MINYCGHCGHQLSEQWGYRIETLDGVFQAGASIDSDWSAVIEAAKRSARLIGRCVRIVRAR